METQVEGAGTFFQAGGPLPADATCYLPRQADAELLAAIEAGEFCYILSSHQMGKSSLMARTAQQLQLGGKDHAASSVAVIELSDLAAHTKSDQWYRAFLNELQVQFGLDVDLEAWWNPAGQPTVTQRIQQFFSDVLLKQIKGRIVVFIDEVERTLSKPFADELLACARACYDARAEKPVFERLVFVFAGVAEPHDLVKDAAQSPFDIGHEIRLTDFTADEAHPLMRGFDVDEKTKRGLLQQIIFWTRGQPYLTQKLCQLIRNGKTKYASDEIDELIFESLLKIDVRKSNDPHLRCMHHWLAGRQEPCLPRRRRRPALLAYRRIKSGKELYAESLPTAVGDDVILWGIALPDDDGLFFVRNPIYDHVFDSKWVRRHLPASRPAVVATACVLVIILWASVYVEWIYPRQLMADLRTAATDTLQIGELQKSYQELRGIPFYESVADQEWGNFSQRCAEQALRGDSDAEDPKYYQLALQARKQITQWSIEDERDQWEDTSQELLAQFFDRRADRCRGALVDQERAILWAIAAFNTHATDNRWNALLDYTRGRGALQRTYRVQFDVLELKWEAEQQLRLVGKFGNSVYVNNTAGERLDVLITPGDVRLLASGPDGKRALSASGANYVRLWDTWTPDPPKALLTPRGNVTSVGMSADGSHAITILNDRYAQLWNAETGNVEHSLMLSDEPLANVILGPQGEQVLTVSKDGILKLWDAATKVEKWKLDTQQPKVSTATLKAGFSPDGKSILCSFGEPPLVRILDVESGAETRAFDLLNPAYDQDGSHLVGLLPGPPQNVDERSKAVSESSELVVIDLTDEDAPFPKNSISVQPQMPDQADKPVSSVPARLLLGPTASQVLVDFGAEVQVIDVNTGSVLISVTPNASNGSTSPLPISFSPNGQLLAIATSSNTVQIWETATASKLARPAEESLMPASPDGTFAMSVWEKKLGLKIRSDGTIGP